MVEMVSRAGLWQACGGTHLGSGFDADLKDIPPRCELHMRIAVVGVEAIKKRREGQRYGLAFTGHSPFAKLRRMRSPPPKFKLAICGRKLTRQPDSDGVDSPLSSG